MSRPQPYYVASREQVTPDEPSIGWYWGDEEDGTHGPYDTRRDAIEAIDRHMFNRGLLEDGSQP